MAALSAARHRHPTSRRSTVLAGLHDADRPEEAADVSPRWRRWWDEGEWLGCSSVWPLLEDALTATPGVQRYGAMLERVRASRAGGPGAPPRQDQDWRWS